ncbi:hypothetical protein, partial [Pseudoalteromonas sp. TB64]|uniref:hypothetical protein n=1 Tax=Pseudoalteromonas sp. TB64 TaxID=1938600 RepID=UPI001C1E197C
ICSIIRGNPLSSSCHFMHPAYPIAILAIKRKLTLGCICSIIRGNPLSSSCHFMHPAYPIAILAIKRKLTLGYIL